MIIIKNIVKDRCVSTYICIENIFCLGNISVKNGRIKRNAIFLRKCA